MRYKLYKQTNYNHDSIIFYINESNQLKTLLLYIENCPLDITSNYLIVDNDTPNPVNYKQLNLLSPPTESEHYKIIYKCKLAKEYYQQIKEDDYDNYYLNYDVTKLLSDSIFTATEFKTAVYFKKYNAKAQK